MTATFLCGHPKSPTNTYVTPQGHTQCRACKSVSTAQYNAARRANRFVTPWIAKLYEGT